MKKIFICLLIAGILSSCSEKTEVLDSIDLIGEWTWVKSTGGVTGDTETPESSGKQMTIEITEENYRKYVNGSLEQELSYFLIQGQSIWSPMPMNMFVFEDESKQSIELDGDKLILYDECYDCYSHEYVRE